MRTTVDIDDDVLSAARTLAREDRTLVGAVLSRLARRGLSSATAGTNSTDFPVFAVPPNAAVFGPDEVAAALDDST